MKTWSARLFPASVATLAIVAGCSDDPRIPDGERFSSRVVGQPGVVLIDDMEDGTQYILSDSERVGLWYVYNDESAGSTQLPDLGFPMYRTRRPDGAPEPTSQVPPRECGGDASTPFFQGEDSCAFVARTWGTGQRGWGAGMGVDLNGEGGVKNPFDASEYVGIGFFAIGNVRDQLLRVNVQDVRTTPESSDAADRRGIERCDDTPARRCNDHYGRNVTISNTWQWYQIPFDCMTSGGWGFPGGAGGPFPEGLVGVQFQVSGADPEDDGMATLPVQAFDFSIDNLSFLEAGTVDPSDCPL